MKGMSGGEGGGSGRGEKEVCSPQTRRAPELSLFAIVFVFKFGRARTPLFHKVAMDGECDGCGYLKSHFATTKSQELRSGSL